MTDYAGSDEYTQIIVDRIRELEGEIDRLQAGMRVTDEVNDSLVKENKRLRAKHNFKYPGAHQEEL